MKAVTGKRMAKLAEQKGWMLARTNGSHHVSPCKVGLNAW